MLKFKYFTKKVAFGIYTDSLNESNNKLNSIISTILEGLNARFKDPLIIVRFCF